MNTQNRYQMNWLFFVRCLFGACMISIPGFLALANESGYTGLSTGARIFRPSDVIQLERRGYAPAATCSSPTASMTYHNGHVMRTFTAYTIFWTPNSTISANYQTLINRYFQDVGGSTFYDIQTQYFENPGPTYIQNNSTLGGTLVDATNAYPGGRGSGANPLMDQDIRDEVLRAIAANPSWGPPDLTKGYFVYTELGVESEAGSNCTGGVTCSGVHYCAYHSNFTDAGHDVIYANMPYENTWDNCGRGDISQSPNGDLDADMEISATSHEHFEASTDPMGLGWFDCDYGGEDGDKCAYYYGSLQSDGHNLVLNGNPYIVQLEWSNADNDGITAFSGCVSRRGHETWTLLASSGPAPRFEPAMAYDAARGRIVLFGGGGPGNSIFGDTWEWDGTTWIQRASSGPAPRANSAMAYDAARGRVVLFGGGGGPDFGDTWEWNGTTWTQRASSGPAPRRAHAMAYDAARGRVVLFGGISSSFFGDTWEWDGAMWTQRPSSGPAPRYFHKMAYDSARSRVVLFGGQDNAYFGDTWEWDGTTWTQRASSGPAPRGAHAIAYDSARGRVVLFGGADLGSYFGDTWEWDGTTWTQRASSGPAPRYGHATAYDAARGRVVLFGGTAPGTVFGDTWEYIGPVRTCTQLPQGAVSWWPADGTATDIVGGNDGILNGVTFVPGEVGQAFLFDGSTSSVDVTDQAAWDLVGDFTIDLWVNFSELTSPFGYPFVAHDNGPGSQNKWVFGWHPLGETAGTPVLRFHIQGPGVGPPHDVIVAPWDPTIGHWYHVAVTRAGSTYALYLDGAEVQTALSATPVPDANASLTIGAAEGLHLNGFVDELEVFSRALASSEIQRIFNAGSAGKCKGDADGDGVLDFRDCAPYDASSFAIPHEINNLRWNGTTELGWDSDAGNSGRGTTYDVMCGDVSDVWYFGTGADDRCLGDDLADTRVGDTSPPPASGKSWFFLVRGNNACGEGRYESATDGRDRMTTICP